MREVEMQLEKREAKHRWEKQSNCSKHFMRHSQGTREVLLRSSAGFIETLLPEMEGRRSWEWSRISRPFSDRGRSISEIWMMFQMCEVEMDWGLKWAWNKTCEIFQTNCPRKGDYGSTSFACQHWGPTWEGLGAGIQCCEIRERCCSWDDCEVKYSLKSWFC